VSAVRYDRRVYGFKSNASAAAFISTAFRRNVETIGGGVYDEAARLVLVTVKVSSQAEIQTADSTADGLDGLLVRLEDSNPVLNADTARVLASKLVHEETPKGLGIHIEGDRIRFLGGATGEHSLAIGASTEERVRAHWAGYVENAAAAKGAA
jgi:hypothetical protein